MDTIPRLFTKAVQVVLMKQTDLFGPWAFSAFFERRRKNPLEPADLYVKDLELLPNRLPKNGLRGRWDLLHGLVVLSAFLGSLPDRLTNANCYRSFLSSSSQKSCRYAGPPNDPNDDQYGNEIDPMTA
ncbi:hypothetical protein L596_029857 [Steinernema carpocapsae]|uniref:Uncharacterized protein n=1 Tax=Steinernema carpocapsae TaxID=34508 RepID=A0A4U5LR18_STECR|nr:hypothetical protein L596_029857 [Steinernema carpocapsae]